MDAACLLAHKAGLEENFRAAEARASKHDDVAIEELIDSSYSPLQIHVTKIKFQHTDAPTTSCSE